MLIAEIITFAPETYIILTLIVLTISTFLCHDHVLGVLSSFLIFLLGMLLINFYDWNIIFYPYFIYFLIVTYYRSIRLIRH